MSDSNQIIPELPPAIRPRDASVSLVQVSETELLCTVTFKIPGKLATESPLPGFTRVNDKSRKSEQKRLRKFIESIVFYKIGASDA